MIEKVWSDRFEGDLDHWLEYEAEKLEILKGIRGLGAKVERIGEIGVYAGYGAYVMLRETGAKRYMGWDILEADSPEIRYAKGIMRMFRGGGFKACISEQNTQEVTHLGGMESTDDLYLDLFHVDGDHHPAACYHDMNLAYGALRDGGWMIVDDYSEDLVRDGVNTWRELSKMKIRQWLMVPGKFGQFAIQVKK